VILFHVYLVIKELQVKVDGNIVFCDLDQVLLYLVVKELQAGFDGIVVLGVLEK